MEIKSKLPKSVSMFPFFGNKVLLVSASLNGGNILDKFIDTILDWNKVLGLGIENKDNTEDRNLIWKRLIELSEKDANSSDLNCVPTVFGERHDRQVYGSISNIRNDNLSIGTVFNSICKGLVKNLNDMITYDLLMNELGCKRIIATGGCFKKNPILKKHFEAEFNYLPIIYKDSCDAAFGAALFLKNQLNNAI